MSTDALHAGDAVAAEDRPSEEAAPDASPAAHPSGAAGLLDSVVALTEEQRTEAVGPLEELLGAPTLEDRLHAWLKHSGIQPGSASPDKVKRLINRDVARIDQLLTQQLNAILHHPRFQKLEASWRGLHFLAGQIDEADNVKIRLLDVSWRMLVRDFDKAIEFDQSQLFRRVYSEEFGNPGGEPFSVLLGDYEIRNGISPGNPIDDVEALRAVSQVAAASFAPFITGVHPTMFGLNSFTELQRPMDLAAMFRQPEFTKWRSLRKTPDARFLGLTMPRMLVRAPYNDRKTIGDGFRFREECEGDHGSYLWGNATYAFGAVLARAFIQSGWLADIRGVRRDLDEGGLVSGLPVQQFATDPQRTATKSSSEVIISDTLEKDLSELGFIPLCHCKDTELSAFYSNSSIQEPEKYNDADANASARLSTMMQYMLCVSRLAHYLKVMGRDKVGSFLEAADCETHLNDWLQKYVSQDDEAPMDLKAQFPLRQANAQVRELPGRPGSYGCVIHLQPHYQLDGMISAVQLTTELAPAG